MTSSMPTSAATARAVAALSPVSRIGREPERAQARDRLGRRRLDRVGDGDGPGVAAVDGDRDAAFRRTVDERRAADAHAPTLDDTFHTQAVVRPEVLHRRDVGGRADDGLRDRVLRGVLDGGGEAQQLRVTGGHAHAPGGDRAGLVEHDRVDTAGGLEDLRPLDEQAELGAAAGADQQRRRRGQAERARAGDDQDGDGRGEGERRALPRPQPEAERRDGERDDDGDEDARDAVGEPLHGGLAGLRVLDELRDLRERGVGPDLRGADDQPAAGVDGGARDLGARRDLDGDGLAREHAHVDGGGAFLHDAVRRDLLPWAHDEPVALLQRVDRDAAGRPGARRPSPRARAAPSARRRRAPSPWPRRSGRRG